MVSDSHRDFVVTSKILREIEDIEAFTKGLARDAYLQDLKTQKAVMMSLINIGELCGAYSESFLKEYHFVPWKQIKAMRNIAAHKYEAVRQADVWETVISDIPELKKVLEFDMSK